MKILLVLMVIQLGLGSISKASSNQSLTMADLTALLDGKLYQELLQKGDQVTPSKRGKDWKTTIGKGFVGYFEEKEIKDLTGKIFVDFAKYADKYPFLKGDKKVSGLYATAALNHLKSCKVCRTRRCKESSFNLDNCKDSLWKYSYLAGEDTKSSEKIAEGLSKKMRPWAALPYYHRALKSGNAAYRTEACESGALFRSADSAMGKFKHDEKIAAMAGKVAFKHCWKQFKPKLVESLTGSTPQYMENVCPELIKRKALKALAKKKCQKVAEYLAE